MPTVSSAPSATRTGEWLTTPARAASLHHLNVDEAFSPGDTADYIQVTGFSGAKVDEFDFPDDTVYLDIVQHVRAQLRISGSADANNPGLRVKLIVDGVQFGPIVNISAVTSGWEEKTIMFTNVNISKSRWERGPRTVYLLPLEGSSFLEPPDFEEF